MTDDAVRVAAAGHLLVDDEIDVQELVARGLDSGRVAIGLRTSAGDVDAFLEPADARALLERLEAAIEYAEAADRGAVRAFVQEADVSAIDAETVAASTGIPRDAVEGALESLVAAGELVQDDDGIYRVPGAE